MLCTKIKLEKANVGRRRKRGLALKENLFSSVTIVDNFSQQTLILVTLSSI